jgi:hypothetical protein
VANRLSYCTGLHVYVCVCVCVCVCVTAYIGEFNLECVQVQLQFLSKNIFVVVYIYTKMQWK